jgi:hypothetical protein
VYLPLPSVLHIKNDIKNYINEVKNSSFWEFFPLFSKQNIFLSFLVSVNIVACMRDSRLGFGLVAGFTGHLQLASTSNNNG